MSTTLQDILNQTNDYLGNYTTGNVEQAQKIRAINRAIELIKRRFGLPSDERIQSIKFSADKIYYDLVDDFDEAILLKYEDNFYNTIQYEWEYQQYPDMMRRIGDSIDRKWSFVTINGRKQLLMAGNNVRAGQTIESFDEIGDWVATGDASNLEADATQRHSGNASLSFDITRSTGVATIKKTTFDLDFQDLFENSGFIKFWTNMSSDNITNIKLKLYTDNSNYYTITATTDDEGTVFAEDDFIKIGFAMDNAVETGTPNYAVITRIDIDYTLPVDFTTGTNFRIDYMFTTFPDNIDLIYYSSIKGTDATGLVNKALLSEVTDILSIGEYFEDFIDLIARRSALNLYPQLRGDKDFYSVYVADFNEIIKTLGRTFPRKRMSNSFQHKLRRN